MHHQGGRCVTALDCWSQEDLIRMRDLVILVAALCFSAACLLVLQRALELLPLLCEAFLVYASGQEGEGGLHLVPPQLLRGVECLQ